MGPSQCIWWLHPGLTWLCQALSVSCICPSSHELGWGRKLQILLPPLSMTLWGDAAYELGTSCGLEANLPLDCREATGLRAVLALVAPSSPGDASSGAGSGLGFKCTHLGQ